MISSNILTGFPRSGSPKKKTTNTSNAVISTPCHNSNLGKSMHKAMADPNSSARSVAMMAISAKAYKGYRPSHRYRRVCLGRL